MIEESYKLGSGWEILEMLCDLQWADGAPVASKEYATKYFTVYCDAETRELNAKKLEMAARHLRGLKDRD